MLVVNERQMQKDRTMRKSSTVNRFKTAAGIALNRIRICLNISTFSRNLTESHCSGQTFICGRKQKLDSIEEHAMWTENWTNVHFIDEKSLIKLGLMENFIFVIKTKPILRAKVKVEVNFHGLVIFSGSRSLIS